MKRTIEVLRRANEMCRSAYQIAAREGKDTNWEAFLYKMEVSLNEQHKVLSKEKPMVYYPSVKVDLNYGQIIILKHALKMIPQSLMLGGGCQDGVSFPVTSVSEITELLEESTRKIKEIS